MKVVLIFLQSTVYVNYNNNLFPVDHIYPVLLPSTFSIIFTPFSCTFVISSQLSNTRVCYSTERLKGKLTDL